VLLTDSLPKGFHIGKENFR